MIPAKNCKILSYFVVKKKVIIFLLFALFLRKQLKCIDYWKINAGRKLTGLQRKRNTKSKYTVLYLSNKYKDPSIYLR